MTESGLDISKTSIMNNYKNNLSKILFLSKIKFGEFLKVVLECIVYIIWWLCTGMVLSSFGIFMICEHNPCISWVGEMIYKYSIFFVTNILETTRVICPEHSRKRVIIDKTRDDPYLERCYLFLKDRETCKFNIFLHKFLKGDEDDIHDHPWGFFHIIISGGYWEYITVNENGETLDQGVKKVWRAPGYYNTVNSDYKHRIVLGDEKPWTLFIPFQKIQSWSFWIPLVWKNKEACVEGDINDNDNMKCTKWKKINSGVYLERKRNMYKNQEL